MIGQSLPGKVFRAIVGLNDAQQKSVMTWGLLGGIAVLTFGLWLIVGRMDAHFPAVGRDALAMAIVGGLVEIARWLVVLTGMFGAGVLLIARGGAMTLRINKDGAEICAEASGAAAKQLASSDLGKTQ